MYLDACFLSDARNISTAAEQTYDVETTQVSLKLCVMISLC